MKRLLKFWLFWFKRQPWSLKWFLWLILLMPVLSMFWDLKSESFLSPLQIAGVLTFFISIYFILAKLIKIRSHEVFLIVFGVLYIGNNLAVFLLNMSLSDFGFILRNLLPLVLYFYLRRVVKNKRDLEGILITFLVSSIIPYTIFLYEFIFDPIKTVVVSEGRGGFVRLTGFYADTFSYLAYIIGDFVIISYLVLQGRLKFNLAQLLLVIGITGIGLIGLSHQASWAVFIGILTILLFLMKKNKLWFIAIFFGAIGIVLKGKYIVVNYIAPLYGKEIRALSGEADQETMLNGRIRRWRRYTDVWKEMSAFNKIVGVGTSNNDNSKNMISNGMHSDYLRMTFASGVLGVICYLLFYLSLLIRKKNKNRADLFLLLASISIMLLYSITANPFGSSGALIYIPLSAFAFIATRKRKRL